jgi:hypothetical protein
MVRFSHGLVSGRTGWSWEAWVGVWGNGLVWGSHRCFATAWSVTDGRGRRRNPRPCRSPTLLAAAAPDPVPAAAAVADPATGAPKRAWRSQAPLKRSRDASGRGATGGRLAPLPWAPSDPHRRFAPSRAPRGTRITGPAEHENSRTGGCAVLENVPVSLRAGKGTFSRGAPSGIAYRRSASQPPRRPSRRPEVADAVRG